MSDISEVVAKYLRDVPDFPKPGILFKDITPLLADGPAFAATVDAMRIGEFDVVAGIEARGFLIGAAIAYAAGVGIVPIRKAGKLPSASLRAEYELEYGTATIEMHTDAIVPGQRVLVVDDVLATGGTLAATLTLLGQVDAHICGVAVILELTALGGRARVSALGYEPKALLAV